MLLSQHLGQSNPDIRKLALPAQKFDPVVFGQNSCFGEFIKLDNREFPGLRLNRHTKPYGAFRYSATRILGWVQRRLAFGV